ncbi:amphi-Trp domain-containing protein [Alkalihalobacterium elongatum]|uniref:amphi-Trp domain-containing protein n=1 Tax=Alkalihalobacterium elongatum TaxID=2675466 RepID=UPI001C1F855D|nr:amphi-Trp domain-containing protein [Alkalihalobacterium elongatum]
MNEAGKIPTQIIFKHKEQQGINEFAEVLETIAKKLREEGQFVFMQGEEEVQVKPSQRLKVEYEYSTKGDKHSFEIEFDWIEGETGPNKMGIK